MNNKNAAENTKLQWHPAFYAGIQIEFEEESNELIFENEYQLGTKPKEVDVLIKKKHDNYQVKKNIGKFFKKYNLFEYKPENYLRRKQRCVRHYLNYLKKNLWKWLWKKL